jgi:hypothetical protein
MIYLMDNFLDSTFLQIIKNHLKESKFTEVEMGGDRQCYVIPSNSDFDDYILSRLEVVEQTNLKNILSFFREATDTLDTKWNIHSDLNIEGQRPDRALVLYLSPRERDDLHGTAFWEHEVYGKELSPDVSNEEYDKMLEVDSEKLEKWKLRSVLGYEENRLISYPSSYFHSKYPNISWPEGRKVYVMFYKFV